MTDFNDGRIGENSPEGGRNVTASGEICDAEDTLVMAPANRRPWLARNEKRQGARVNLVLTVLQLSCAYP
jgi:hypothetical protein